MFGRLGAGFIMLAFGEDRLGETIQLWPVVKMGKKKKTKNTQFTTFAVFSN